MSEMNNQENNPEEAKEKQQLEFYFEQLEEVVSTMESQNISLEESFQLYKKGMTLLKNCNDTIDRVEKQVMMMDESGELHEF